MNRKQFIFATTAGFLGTLASPGVFGISNSFYEEKGTAYPFKKYRPDKTAASVLRVTPDDGFYVHTFFDVCPWSPSGKYLAVTKLPYEAKKPVLGDCAEVALIDLANQTIRSVYKTRAWSFQLGANVQWGADDRYVYTNDVINHVAVTVRIDTQTGETNAYAGPKYDINRAATAVIGSRIELLNATQYGYGMPDDANGFPVFANPAFENEDGLWFTSLKDNQKRLLFSYGDVREVITDASRYTNGTFYFFHSKFNASGDRIYQVVRCLMPDRKGRNPGLVVYDMRTGDLREAIDQKTWEHKGPMGIGNHPSWHPDGEHILMNLVPGWEGDNAMRFCLFKCDGSDKKVLSRTIAGSGHPSIEPTSRYLITDAYPGQEWVASRNGEVPIRLIDLQSDREQTICNIFTDLAGKAGLKNYKVPGGGSHFKLDPHPAWSRDYKHICFNGAPEGSRQVFVSDLRTVLNH